MTDDTKNKETAPKLTESEKVEVEAQIEVTVPELEVVKTVPEIVVETTPEAPLEIPVTIGEASAEPMGTVPETETTQIGEIEPPAEDIPAEKPESEKHVPLKREEKAKGDEPPQKEKLGLLRKMAQAIIQLRVQKKLLKVMELFAKHTEITNDDVEKLLHVSDATATRYLDELEKRGKIQQVGATGRSVKYIRR